MTHEERRALWAKRVADQQASGGSAAAWCAQWDVPLGAFYARRQRLTAPEPATVTWAAVSPSSKLPGLTLRVGAVAIEVTAGFDAQVLAEVLAVVARA